MRSGSVAFYEDLELNAFVFLGCNRRGARHDGALLAVRRGRALGRRNVSMGHAGHQRHRLLHHRVLRRADRSDGRVFVGSTARQFVMVGMCGGYTTFSSFSLQTLNLMNDGEWLQAGANIGLSVLLCMIAVWAGVVLAGSINAMR